MKHCFSCVFWQHLNDADTVGFCEILKEALKIHTTVSRTDKHNNVIFDVITIEEPLIATPEKFGCPAHMWKDEQTAKRSDAAKRGHLTRTSNEDVERCASPRCGFVLTEEERQGDRICSVCKKENRPKAFLVPHMEPRK